MLLHSHLVKNSVVSNGIRYNDEGDLIIPVIGHAFGSPEARDLEGDFFHEKTNLGPLDRVISYFDHQQDEIYVQKGIGLGSRPVGYADKKEKLPQGQKWEIVYQLKSIPAPHLDKNSMDAAEFEQAITDRRKKYLQVIEKAAREGLLEASSIAYDRVDDPDVKGKIDEWDTIGMDLTPTNADTRAHVLKSIDLGGDGMPTEAEIKEAEEKKKKEEAEAAAKVKADAEAKVKAEADAKAAEEAAKKNPVVDQIDRAFAGLDNPGEQQPNVAELLETVKSLSKAVESLTDLVKTEMAKITGDGEESVKSLAKKSVAEILNTQIALPSLGTRIATYVKGDAAGILKLQREQEEMITRQKHIEEQKRKSNGFPANAPGGN